MPSKWPVFWRVQLTGWLCYLVATYPFKLSVFGDPVLALVISVLRDGTGFLLTLGLRQIYKRWNPRKIATPWIITGVLVLSALAETIETAVTIGFQQLTHYLPEHAVTPSFLLGVFAFRGMLFAFWSLLYFWIKSWREAQESTLRLARAESRRREAELQMLRAQVNPHFLFNALNTIQSGLTRDQQSLQRVVLGLADYLRYSLAHRDLEMVPLGGEFDAILQYLKVEQGRFRDELVVEAEIEEAVRSFPVPGVILQPLVENAVHYGMEDLIRPLRIRLRAWGTGNGQTILEVANTGGWIESKGRRADGTGGSGLETLRRRLELLYPDRHRLEISKDNGWVKVTIHLGLSESLKG